jgi:hypothetical protein
MGWKKEKAVAEAVVLVVVWGCRQSDSLHRTSWGWRVEVQTEGDRETMGRKEGREEGRERENNKKTTVGSGQQGGRALPTAIKRVQTQRQ